MNFIVVSFLSDQFDQLHDKFSKCVGDRGEFRGNVAKFRRRHQSISRTVQEADKFLMISNAAYFCCQIISIIFTAAYATASAGCPLACRGVGSLHALQLQIGSSWPFSHDQQRSVLLLPDHQHRLHCCSTPAAR